MQNQAMCCFSPTKLENENWYQWGILRAFYCYTYEALITKVKPNAG